MFEDGNAMPQTVMGRFHKTQASVTARRNWRKALDDVKKARASGVYDIVNNESEEFTARERVKSILQSASPMPVKKIRPKSAGDAVRLNTSDVIYTFILQEWLQYQQASCIMSRKKYVDFILVKILVKLNALKVSCFF